ncbi:MAG: radical SAM family heme chaperone HemW [Crocinitomicaceae bacterium]|nr:radical SAM family heme chaperone HemW [Crocinitomicaceae bacterium]MCF8432899.1 radical SAM family heme chaperone HemW [Crocinitomicaceae bacterium]
MAGIYIHIPFCKQKCTYCDFHFSTTFEAYRTEMIATICQEIVLRANELNKESIKSIYFGGGTPSLLTEQELKDILTQIKRLFNIEENAEITLEANPDDIKHQQLKIWKDAGINRLSIGIQSFRADDLSWMNRAHSVEEAENAVRLAQEAGFQNITVDLIYGLPNLSLEEWKDHIQRVLNMNVNHLSAYCLTVEEKTLLNKLVKEKKIIPANEDQQSDQFELLVSMTELAGFEQYEISNFAKNQHYAIHNTNYWTSQMYLGVGPSAHSFDGESRRWNVSNNRKYMESMGKDSSWFSDEKLSVNERWNELLLTGLRTNFGVSIDQLKKINSISPAIDAKITEFVAYGWMEKSSTLLRLTKEGKLKADYIASELFLT